MGSNTFIDFVIFIGFKGCLYALHFNRCGVLGCKKNNIMRINELKSPYRELAEVLTKMFEK